MDSYTEELQIEELMHFDVFETLMEDPTILDDDVDLYDDPTSFDSFLNSGNDF
jgi:hypothetical protein